MQHRYSHVHKVHEMYQDITGVGGYPMACIKITNFYSFSYSHLYVQIIGERGTLICIRPLLLAKNRILVNDKKIFPYAQFCTALKKRYCVEYLRWTRSGQSLNVDTAILTKWGKEPHFTTTLNTVQGIAKRCCIKTWLHFVPVGIGQCLRKLFIFVIGCWRAW